MRLRLWSNVSFFLPPRHDYSRRTFVAITLLCRHLSLSFELPLFCFHVQTFKIFFFSNPHYGLPLDITTLLAVFIPLLLYNRFLFLLSSLRDPTVVSLLVGPFRRILSVDGSSTVSLHAFPSNFITELSSGSMSATVQTSGPYARVGHTIAKRHFFKNRSVTTVQSLVENELMAPTNAR